MNEFLRKKQQQITQKNWVWNYNKSLNAASVSASKQNKRPNNNFCTARKTSFGLIPQQRQVVKVFAIFSNTNRKKKRGRII